MSLVSFVVFDVSDAVDISGVLDAGLPHQQETDSCHIPPQPHSWLFFFVLLLPIHHENRGSLILLIGTTLPGNVTTVWVLT